MNSYLWYSIPLLFKISKDTIYYTTYIGYYTIIPLGKWLYNI